MGKLSKQSGESHFYMSKKGVEELVEFFLTIGYVSLAAMEILQEDFA